MDASELVLTRPSVAPDEPPNSGEQGEPTPPEPSGGRPGWLRMATPLLRPVAIFCASRAGLLMVAWAVSYIRHRTFAQILDRWDSGAYVITAQLGYARRLPPLHASATAWKVFIAFFPLYPLSIRIVHDVTGLGWVKAGYAAGFAGGLAGAVLLWLLVRDRYGPEAADRATALVFCFPGAFVLSMTYSETILIPCVAGCLLALAKKKWVLAGILAALATAANPPGIAIVVPCVWASVSAIRSRREWRSLIAPILSPGGVIAYFCYLWVHIGTPLAWFEVEHHGWSQSLTPLAMYDQLHLFFHFGIRYPNYTAWALGFFVAIPVAAYAIWKRCEGTWLTYGLTIFLIGLLTPLNGFGPRPFLHAFPLIAFAGVGLRRAWFTSVLVVSVLLMAVCAIVSFGSPALTP
jgi:hypothetical protein